MLRLLVLADPAALLSLSAVRTTILVSFSLLHRAIFILTWINYFQTVSLRLAVALLPLIFK